MSKPPTNPSEGDRIVSASVNASEPYGSSIESLLGARQIADARGPLQHASTLPATAFTSPGVYALEVERIFRRQWLCVGRGDQVANPGDYFTVDLLGDRLVVVRGRDGKVRVLSRVCRHRAAEVVKGSGNARSFQCPYHAWTYQLDGQLVGAPHMEGAQGFDRATCRLPEMRSEIWEGWVFVNFDENADGLADQLAPLSKIFSNYRMSEMVAVESLRFDSAFNWKVLVDNFMEAYHHIAIHRDTFEPIFPGGLSHSPDNDGPYSVLVMPEKPGLEHSEEAAAGALPKHGSLLPEQENRLIVAAAFPFHLFAPTAESLVWYQIVPGGVDRFTLYIYACLPESTLADERYTATIAGLREFLRLIHHQDIEACEAVWAGLSSGSFESGRLSTLEKPIWQFNQWWLDRMGAPK
jgi:phenylpropionate dioxygenase-like ring-hydroxylating dioxygenase large terminal subunit